MNKHTAVPFSVLDLSPIVKDGTAADAFRNSLDLAQHAEAWGYHRYWLAEHHNMRGVASAATSVVIGHIAGGTRSIRVGAGGVMLPNHSPLVIAEQFGTLESLYPGRIDLGLGRAPGADMLTAYALRRDMHSADNFPQDVQELLQYFEAEQAGQQVRAVPGVGLQVPVWLLGSSLYNAQLAAAFGLPFAFASHFAPASLMQAVQIYRAQFKPSKYLQRPYAMVGVNVFAADTDTEAQLLFSSLQQQFIQLRRGSPGPLQPPINAAEADWTVAERAGVRDALSCCAIGSKQTVELALEEIVRKTQADELLITAQIFDHAARLNSFEIAAQVLQALPQAELAMSVI